MKLIRFLSVDNVLTIHEDTICHEGGLGGVRAPGLLQSAVMTPQARFTEKWLHPSLAAMAAAYHFHLCQDHPFHDGNKRVAVMAALVFLDVNGTKRLPPPRKLEKVTLAVASGMMTTAELVAWWEGQAG
ncbi:MAG: type II toxin-antitoxin system death-on-curing family toxin [Phycisphaerae bacterium]|nr:type II toxin-antitoxin system death-on-curing family toxin [Phycisphaerae bacterium]